MIEHPRAIRVPVADLDLARQWYSSALQVEPDYRDENSITFVVDGCLLILESGALDRQSLTRVYWGVEDLPGEYARLCAIGRTDQMDDQLVEVNPMTAEVFDPFGNVFGLFAINGKSERASRVRRVEQKLALQNVREALDQINEKETEQQRIGRAFGWFAVIALVVFLAVIWAMVNERTPSEGPHLIVPVNPSVR